METAQAPNDATGARCQLSYPEYSDLTFTQWEKVPFCCFSVSRTAQLKAMMTV